MRLVIAASIVYVITLGVASSGTSAGQPHFETGQEIFRFDTFGDEQLWTDVLRMHEVLPTVSPNTAVQVGLKVDADALPADVKSAILTGQVNLNNPAVTVELLRLNAVVGVKGAVSATGQLTSVGITCALCHSTVDNSFLPNVGRRLDGWANPSLDVGKIVALSPALDDATKDEFRMWGPGKYDPRHHAFDGERIVPLNTPSLPVVIPPIYGLSGVAFETYTGDGPISYWNAYVGVGQMGGKGHFNDPRIGLSITQPGNLVTPKLLPLLRYQLSLSVPRPDPASLDQTAVDRGRVLFANQAKCATCHQGSTFTDVASGRGNHPILHHASETGMDPRYAERSATKQYRTTPLRGLLQHPPYFHDGSAVTLRAVVDHYNRQLNLNLSEAQKNDLVEYLKSL